MAASQSVSQAAVSDIYRFARDGHGPPFHEKA